MTQCDKVLELDRRHEGDRERTIEAYTAAERRSEISRKSNVRGKDAEQYAPEQCNGVLRGWITELPPTGFWVHMAWNPDQTAWIDAPQTQPKETKGRWNLWKFLCRESVG